MISGTATPARSEDTLSREDDWSWAEAQKIQALLGGPSSEEAEPPKPANPLRMVLRALRGRWMFAAGLGTCLSIAMATAGYIAKQPIYVSGGLVQLSPIKSNILYNDQDDSRLRLFDAFVQAEFSYMQSNPVLERAISLPEMRKIAWPQDLEGITKLRKTLEVTKKEGLITITAGFGDPFDAATILNSVLSAYESLHIEELQTQDSIRERELAKREASLLTKLQDFNKQILEIGQEYGTDSIAMAHSRKIAQAEEVDQRISELELTIATKESADPANNVNIGDSEIKRLLVLDHAMADMLFERSKMAAQLAILETQHAEEHHSIIEAKAGLAVIDKAVEARRDQLSTLGSSGALTQGSGAPKEETVDDLKSLRERFGSRLEGLQKEARELNERLVRLQFLSKERDETRILLEEARRALEQVRVESQHSLPGTIEIKSRGRVSLAPATDKRVTFAGAGGVFGLVAGFAMTAGFGLVRRRLRFSDDLSEGRPDIPLLGIIPDSSHENPDADPEFIFAVQRLRVELQLSIPPGRTGQVIALLGTRHQAGSSLLARALANAYAEAGVETILVDADFTESGISRDLQLMEVPGVRESLRDLLVGERLRGTPQARLRVLPIGGEHDLGDSQVSQRPLAGLINQLRGLADMTILDLGPLPHRLAARLGAALSDHVLCVVPAGSASGEVDPVLNDLQTIVAKRISTIWNHARPADPALL